MATTADRLRDFLGGPRPDDDQLRTLLESEICAFAESEVARALAAAAEQPAAKVVEDCKECELRCDFDGCDDCKKNRKQIEHPATGAEFLAASGAAIKPRDESEIGDAVSDLEQAATHHMCKHREEPAPEPCEHGCNDAEIARRAALMAAGQPPRDAKGEKEGG